MGAASLCVNNFNESTTHHRCFYWRIQITWSEATFTYASCVVMSHRSALSILLLRQGSGSHEALHDNAMVQLNFILLSDYLLPAFGCSLCQCRLQHRTGCLLPPFCLFIFKPSAPYLFSSELYTSVCLLQVILSPYSKWTSQRSPCVCVSDIMVIYSHLTQPMVDAPLLLFMRSAIP